VNLTPDMPGRNPGCGLRAAGRVAEQQVERRCGAGAVVVVRLVDAGVCPGGGAHSLDPSGASTSRRRIFPVGPLGSAPTIQTARGHL
jgi:hypothetical protein